MDTSNLSSVKLIESFAKLSLHLQMVVGWHAERSGITPHAAMCEAVVMLDTMVDEIEQGHAPQDARLAPACQPVKPDTTTADPAPVS